MAGEGARPARAWQAARGEPGAPGMLPGGRTLAAGRTGSRAGCRGGRRSVAGGGRRSRSVAGAGTRHLGWDSVSLMQLQRLAASVMVGSVTALAAGGASAAASGDVPWATLDRISHGSRMHAGVGTAFPDPGWPDLALRLDLGLQHTGRSGFGAYGTLPLSLALSDPSEAALGNLEIGGLYASGPLLWRLGLVVGTADDSPLGAATNAVSLAPRLTDAVSIQQSSPWLRLSVSPLISSGALVMRFDGGVDLSLDGDGGSRAYGRLNGAVGVRLDRVVVGGELASLHRFGDGGGGSRATLALSASLDRRSSQPYFAIVWPLGDAVPRVDVALSIGTRWSW